MRRLLIALALLIACEDRQHIVQDDNEAEGVYVPGTFGGAACPAPGTQAAESYHASGGAASALQWYLLMHALSGPSHHEVHHVYHPAPTYARPEVVRQVVYRRPVYSRPTFVRTAPVTKPAPTFVRTSPSPSTVPSKPSVTYTKQVSKPSSSWSLTTSSKSSTGVVPKSPSYGTKPAPRPSSSSFRSSSSSSSSSSRSRR